MSLAQSFGAIRNKKDYRKKEMEYIDNLRRQAKLNKDYEKAVEGRVRVEKLDIPKVAFDRSLEEEEKDYIFQQNLALKNLKTIMKANEARKALDLFNQDELFQLNSLFGKIEMELKGRTNISASFFRQVFDRYLNHIKNTGGTGIAIPLTQETLTQLSDDLKEQWKDWSLKYIDTTGHLINIENLIAKTAEYLGRSIEDVKDEIKYFSPSSRPPISPPKKRIGIEKVVPSKGPSIDEEGLDSIFSSPKEEVITPPKAQSKKEETPSKDEIINIFKMFNPEGEELTKSQASNIYTEIKQRGLIELLNRKYSRMLAKPFNGKVPSDRTQYEKSLDKILDYGKGGGSSGFGLGGLRPPLPPRNKKERGVNGGHAPRRGRPKVIFGKGIEPVEENVIRYKKFGKYFVETQKLDKDGVLTVKYKSNTPVVDIPQKHISKELQNLIKSIIDDGLFDKSKFNKLSETDQNYFTVLARKCGLSKTIGLSSMSPKERDDMKQFDLLRGEIIAGNTNMDIIKELQRYVIKFLNEGTINKRYGNDLLYELTCLVN